MTGEQRAVTIARMKDAYNTSCETSERWEDHFGAAFDVALVEIGSDPIVVFAIGFLDGFLQSETEEARRHWAHIKATLIAPAAEGA